MVSSYTNDYHFIHTTHHFNDVLINDFGYAENSVLWLSTETTCGYCSKSIDRDMITTESNFESACAEVASWVENTDEVIVWYCGHNHTHGVSMGVTDSMSSAEVANALDDIANAGPAEYYILWDMCEAEEVIDALESNEIFSGFDNWLAFGSSSINQESHFHDYLSWWGYDGISCALNKSLDSFDDADELDYDNGKVSMYELFEFAEAVVDDEYGVNQTPLLAAGEYFSEEEDQQTAYIGD